MNTPGIILKKEREKQKKSLQDISGTLKIHLNYLKAIESDSYEDLPPEVFLKAYLRMYADELHLDPGYILNLFEKINNNGIADNEPPLPAVEAPPAPLEKTQRLAFTGKKVAGILLGLTMLIVFSIFLFTKDKEPPPRTERAVEESKPESVVSAEPETLALKIEAVEITWVSIRIDGANPAEWLLRPGDDITLTANRKFIVKIGNAGGTRIIFNNKDLGKLGPHGKVVSLILP
jgi:cytoskeletal protein RodZ